MDIFALDFDGVLCDSADETAVTAWRAARALWPDSSAPEPPAELASRFRRLRPVIETGFEAVLLMRFIETGVPEQAILGDFQALCRSALEHSGRSAEDLTELFGRTRDQWIARDLQGWLSHHRFYPGVIDALALMLARSPVLILTTKQQRFAHSLLQWGGIDFPADRIFGLEDGRRKEDILAALISDPALRGARFHFVEDRLATLSRVLGRDDLAEVRLYLAAWGYNTADERRRAEALPRIQVLTLEQFAAL
jgi:phosphoglycolate phosphatase-like HAD superfamily hydrolase